MYESKREPGKKFGSAFVGRRFDSYADGEQPEAEAESKDHGKDEVNSFDKSESEGGDKHTIHEEHPEPSELVEAHGPAHQIHYEHNSDTGTSKLVSHHEDGTTHESNHSSAAEAFEQGGKFANTDVKRREHPDQQGAQSEEDNFEMPDLA